MARKNGRKMSKGFTLIEMMVVIAIIAALAAFGVPKYQKAMARARMIDAVTALASAGGQVAVYCSLNPAVALPNPNKLAQKPSGYGAISGWETKTCSDAWELYVTPPTNTSLPLAIISVTQTVDRNGLVFGWAKKNANDKVAVEDIPAASPYAYPKNAPPES